MIKRVAIFALCCFASLTASSLARAAIFTVSGTGTVSSSSALGAPGEQVTFSFAYDDSNFADGTTFGTPAIGRIYSALVNIPVTVTGSVTGLISVDSISQVEAADGPSSDQWSYRSGVNGQVQANASSGSAFTSLPPLEFADANAIFVNQLSTTSLWQFSSNILFGKPDTGGTLQLQNSSVTVSAAAAEVPEPASILIWAFSGLGILGLRLVHSRR